MKRILLSVFVLFFVLSVSAQTPSGETPVGSATLTQWNKGVQLADSGYQCTNFADTFALNRGWLKGIAGLLVRVADTSFYVRNQSMTRWVKVGGSGGVNNLTLSQVLNNGNSASGNSIDSLFQINVGEIVIPTLFGDSIAIVGGTGSQGIAITQYNNPNASTIEISPESGLGAHTVISSLNVTNGNTSVFNYPALGLNQTRTVPVSVNGTPANTGGNIVISSLPPSGTAGGDLTGTYPNPTLIVVNSSPGVIGDASHTPVITVDSKGRSSSIVATAIQIDTNHVTGYSAGVALKKNISDSNLTEGYTTRYKTQQDSIALAAALAARGITALTGDVTASGTGSVATTLATVNSNVGSFTNANITVNGKGLITAASNGSSSSGTVTSVSVTTVNGVSGTVATATTTPAISLTLGNITPTSIAVSGTAGAGYINFSSQSASIPNPASNTNTISDSTGIMYTGSNGIRLLLKKSILTANRIDTFPDESGIIMHRKDSIGSANPFYVTSTQLTAINLQSVCNIKDSTSTPIFANRFNANAVPWSGLFYNIAGDSKAFGAGLTGSDTLNRWTLSLCHTKGRGYINSAVGGETVSDTTNGNNFFTYLKTFPTRANTTSDLFIWLGTNDGTAGFRATLFDSTYSRCIDTLTLNRGYSASQMHILFGFVGGNSTYTTLEKAYHDSLVSICKTKNVQFIDFYAAEKAYTVANDSLFVNGGIHENALGNNFVYNFVSPRLPSYQLQDSAATDQVIANGIIDGNRLRFRFNDSLPTLASSVANLSPLMMLPNGFIIPIPNCTLVQNNPLDSAKNSYTLNTSNDILGGIVGATSTPFATGYQPPVKDIPSMTLQMTSTYGALDAGTTWAGNNLPIKIGNGLPVVIGNIFTTPNSNYQLQVIGQSAGTGGFFATGLPSSSYGGQGEGIFYSTVTGFGILQAGQGGAFTPFARTVISAYGGGMNVGKDSQQVLTAHIQGAFGVLKDSVPLINALNSNEVLTIDTAASSLGKISRTVLTSPTLFTQTASSTITGTTSETVVPSTGIGTDSIAANYIVAGKVIRLSFAGVNTMPAITAGTVVVKIYYGSTVVATGTTSATGLAGLTNASFNAAVNFTCQTGGATGTAIIDGALNYSTGNNLAKNSLDLNNGGAQLTGIDFTSKKRFYATFTLSTATTESFKTNTYILQAMN